ncbi:MAG: biotin transporter BioY [Rhodobacteraceae bacterium]|nr:biotin transporter BioY [Paracoccaceae bacterium]
MTDHSTPTPRSPAARLARDGVAVLAGSLVMAIAAHIEVPMWPVPMTLQMLAVFGLALGFGFRLATAMAAAYLVEGALGLPVFAAGGGIAYFAGPTAGYLFGFLLAAAMIGFLADRGWSRDPVRASAAAFIGAVVVYVLGVAWLAALIGPVAAVKGGVLPFLPGEAVKIVLAGLALPALRRLIATL